MRQVGDGVLKRVEEEAGTLVVDSAGGEAGGDLGEGGLDLGAVAKSGEGGDELEGVRADDVDDGIDDAVADAGVLIADGEGATAAAFGVVMHALVRAERLGLHLVPLVHMVSTPYVTMSSC